MKIKIIRRNCAELGCQEYGIAEYANLKEAREIERRPWRCTRHTNPEEVLGPNNRRRETTYVLSKVENGPQWGGGFAPGLYWLENGKGHGSGFIFGPGFKAFQKDFPEGTNLIVTAQIKERGNRRWGIPAQFMECDTCAAKSGSPTLCAGCLNNRMVIGALHESLRRSR